MSARREFTLNTLLPSFEISNLNRPIDINQELKTDIAIIDFGSGMGSHTLDLAKNNPQVGVLAIEVHTVGLLEVVAAATELELTNICTHHGDGIDVVKNWLKPESIAEVHILFPDPWPKARHNKRRLMSNMFIDITLRVLVPGGRILFVTDDGSYFESATASLVANPKVQVQFDDWEIPLTTYHQRALRLNHKIAQLSATKI
jgi:tRNA (guanine-N7-)-methyltransferase